MKTTWVKYETEGTDYIPIDRWGSDHWGTFAYLETRAVDYQGTIENLHMRCNSRLHRELVGKVHGTIIGDGAEYPTILKGGELLDKHDDWSCLEDMVVAGLIEAEFTESRPGMIFGDSKGRVKFTEKGLAIAAQLRAHKANGGKFSTFSVEVE